MDGCTVGAFDEYATDHTGLAPAGKRGAEPVPCRLRPHVFVCTHGRYTVFLDLRGDRYHAVETVAAMPILRRIEGWTPEAAGVTGDAGPAGDVGEADDGGGGGHETRMERLARSLLARGLLTLDRSGGKVFSVHRAERPGVDLMDVGLGDSLRLGARDVARFAVATIAAWVAIRCLPLERLVSRVSRRRARRGVRAGSFDPERARRCAAVFERLRPLAFSARGACLFESLAFIELAARYGLYPQWVFGVQTAPFAAHCWVQHGSLVLNDSAENAAAYTPILVV